MLSRALLLKKIQYWTPPVLWAGISRLRAQMVYRDIRFVLGKNAELRGSHKGERCFLLGSGPSVKLQNLKLLKEDVVFALNNFYVHPDFPEIMGGNKKKYYVLAPTHRPQSRQEWTSWLTDMSRHVPDNATMLFGVNGYQDNIRSILNEHKLFLTQKRYWYFPGINSDNTAYHFSDNDIDICRPIISADTVAIYALIWALYCGFSKIYLLGMDHDYFLFDTEEEMRMYPHAIHQANEMQRTFAGEFYVYEFLRQYKIFKKYKMLDTLCPGRICNASAGGILKVFPKVAYNELFS